MEAFSEKISAMNQGWDKNRITVQNRKFYTLAPITYEKSLGCAKRSPHDKDFGRSGID
jgi:hypothetical protein